MIQKYLCDQCEHSDVCKNIELLKKFDSESSKYIGIDIAMNECKNFLEHDKE